MKSTRKNSLRRGLRIAGTGAAIAVALGFTSVGAANADTFVPLPDGQITQTLPDGTVVTVSRTGESANISPSLGDTPLHRNAWVSGTTRVNLKGPNATGGRIQPGYIVGCQVNFGANAGANAGMTAGMDTDMNLTSVGPKGNNGTGGVTLGPGQAVDYKILDVEVPDAYGQEIHYPFTVFKGNNGSVNWSDSTLGVTGCAGYAQARNYVKVTVDTKNAVEQVTLWGEPFSIG